jgi:hypothetical protein
MPWSFEKSKFYSMECVASDCVGVVWEGFYDGAVFEGYSGFLDLAASLGEVAAKTRCTPKIQFGLAPTGTYKPNV